MADTTRQLPPRTSGPVETGGKREPPTNSLLETAQEPGLSTSAGFRLSIAKRSDLALLTLRWLLPLTGLLLILLASFNSLTHRRYDSTNGVTGEIIRKHNVGQTFVSRYPDLSAIEVRVGLFSTVDGHAPSGLVLHLRDNPDAVTDLATATVPAAQIVPGDGWYRFSFPPVRDTRNRSLYLEIESPDGEPNKAVTLFRWQFQSVGNPYGDGAAYSDRVRQHADLTFGLVYELPPITLFALMLGDAFGQAPGASLVVLLALCLSVGLWVRWLRRTQVALGWSAALHKGTLPVVLSVGLFIGLVNMILTPPWQGTDEHAHFAYVALLERYDLNNSRVQGLRSGTLDPDNDLALAVSASMDRSNFTRFVVSPNPGGQADAAGSLLWEVHQPAPYYWLCAAVLHVGRILHLAPDPYRDPAGALMWIRAVSVMLSLVVIGLAWLAGSILGGVQFAWLQLTLALTVALLPMHAFMAGLADNDIAAEVVCSAMFVAIAALFRWPTGKRAGVFLALALALGIATRFTKASAYAMLPFLAAALVLWLFLYAAKPGLSRLGAARSAWRLSRPARLAFIVGIGLAIVALPFVLLHGDSRSAGWQTSFGPVMRASRVMSTSAHAGHYVLQLSPRGEAASAAEQMLVPNVYHRAFAVTLSGWARLASMGTSQAEALLVVSSAGKNLATGGSQLTPDRGWVPISVSAKVPEGDRAVMLQAAAYGSGTAIQFDDMSLNVTGSNLVSGDLVASFKLVNPSFEEEGTTLLPAVKRLLPASINDVIDSTVNPQPFNKTSLWVDFAVQEFRSFWGNFGWLAIPLPGAAYWLIGVAVILCFVALAAHASSRMGSWTWQHWLGMASVLGISLGILAVFAQQTTTLAFYNRTYSYPQGRYLFVAIIPIAWLLISGLQALYTGSLSAARRILSRNRAETGLRERIVTVPWGVWLLCASLALFAAYCLLGLIVPYFYG